MSQELIHKINQYVYMEEDILGHGANGRVFLGTNTQNDQKVAIKVIDLHNINNQVTKYLLETQRKLQKLLRINMLSKDNICYIITEFCDGGTLKTFLDSKSTSNPHPNMIIPEQQALRLIMKICIGLSALADKGFIHRDLKTANIMLRNEQLVIIDLGFCDNIHGNKPNIFYNVGSPSYMSPQAYINTKYSFKSDIWAVGVIFYELFFGKTLDRGEKIEHYFSRISVKGVQIPNCLGNFTKKLMTSMLSLNPDIRPSADNIVQKIKSFFASNNKIEKFNGNPQIFLPKNILHGTQQPIMKRDSVPVQIKYGQNTFRPYYKQRYQQNIIRDSPLKFKNSVEKINQYYPQQQYIRKQQNVFKQQKYRPNSSFELQKNNQNQRIIRVNYKQHPMTPKHVRKNSFNIEQNFAPYHKKNQNFQFQTPYERTQPSSLVNSKHMSQRRNSDIHFHYPNQSISRQHLPYRGANSQIKIFSQPPTPKKQVKFVYGPQIMPQNMKLRHTIDNFARKIPQHNIKNLYYFPSKQPYQQLINKRASNAGLRSIQLINKPKQYTQTLPYKKKFNQIAAFKPTWNPNNTRIKQPF